MAVRKRCMVSFVSYALFTMSSPGQTSLAYAETAGLRSGKSTHSSPSEKELALHIELEQTVIPTQALQTRQYATISPQLSDLKTVVQDSPATGGSRRSRRRLTKSTLSGRQDTRRQSRTELRLLYVFLTVTLGIYLTKYLSRCVLPPRPAGLSSNTTLPGLQHLKAGSPLSDSLSSSSGRVRRLAASEGSDGSGESRKTMGSQEESKDPICDAPSMSENFRRVQFGNYVTSGYGIGGLFGGAHSSSGETGARGYALGVADVQAAGDNREPANVVAESASEFLEGRAPPGSRHAEASILRLVATQVMNAAATASAALPKTCHSTTCLRQALQLMSETYGMLLEEAGTLESPPSGIGDKTQSVDNPSDSGTPAAREKTSPLEHNFNSHSAERMSGSTSDAKSDEAQPVHAGRPVSLDMQLWRRLDFSLGTIFEAEDAEQDGGDDGDVGIERRSSFFTLSGRSGDDEDDTQPSSLEEAMSIVGMDEGMVGGWNPFSSTTSTSDAWGKFVTDQSDARETAGDDANDVTGSPPRRPSYSEVVKHASRSLSAPPRSTAANGQGMAKRVAGLGQRLISSGHRQSATSRDVSGGRRHYPSGPRVPGRRPTNRFESIDRSASHRRAGARPSLPSRPPPKPPLPQISKVGFGASGTPVQRGASQGGTPSGSENAMVESRRRT
ncbi:toxoplasma gondii family E protein, partial [Toxoplasma gondii VEG]